VTVKTYLISLPERLVRSLLGLSAGAAREVGELVLPAGVRRTRLYRNIVAATLRLLIEKVGGVEGVYGKEDEALPQQFLARRSAGNAIEALGLMAFRASPVWVLAALADLAGLGRQLIPEITAALRQKGLIDADTQFTSVDQLLDGMEHTSARLAATINTPPLDVAGLREEWAALRHAARGLQPASLPSAESLGRVWNAIKAGAAEQQRSVFETSSIMALSAIRALPQQALWLANSAGVGALRTGQVLAGGILDHYRETLQNLQQEGFLNYAARELRPYLRAAAQQFSPSHRTLTQRLLHRVKGP
jgi:hypothetical protein